MEIQRLPWYTEQLDPDLKQELDSRKIAEGRFLDLGTGPATQAFALARRGFEVVGTDISESAVEVAIKRQSKMQAHDQAARVKFLQDDIVHSKLVISDNFDYIFDRGCFHVLAPENRPLYITNVASMLRPHGLMFLKTFSTQEPRSVGPYHFSTDMIAGLFKHFDVIDSKETVYQGTLDVLPKALFSVLRKKPS